MYLGVSNNCSFLVLPLVTELCILGWVAECILFRPHKTCVSCQAWPPEKGEFFMTSVLSFSFSDAAFWRGKAVAMSEVVTFARSIVASRFREAG